MASLNQTQVSTANYQGTDKLILGIVLAVVTFWLFAQTTLNIAPAMQEDLQISYDLNNLAVSITALFSGIFIVVAGGLADRLGRVKLTNIGLLLSVIGSILIVISPTGTAVLLLAGRILQGLSAACIMPATLALMKAYYEGKERQRALSFWSIGSWGGSGLSALFGGLIASTMGWRWIFILSILVAVISYLLIRGTPESKSTETDEKAFDWAGLIAFIIAMLAINIVIGQGASLGWLSPAVLAGIAVFIISTIIFLRIEKRSENGFVDLSLFSNQTFSGASLSNFLLNGAAGTLLVSLALVQAEAGLSSLQSGLITVGYLVAVLSTIRVGEKLLQRMGPRKPMLMGCFITGVGILLTSLTFLLAEQYIIVSFIGFTLFGIGLGFYATPSTDAALSNVPGDKAGSASGIYKMASSLGAAFGVAISAAIFYGLSEMEGIPPMADLFLGRTDNITVRYAAGIGLLFNVFMIVVAIIAIIMTIPKGKPKEVLE
ncbi:MFS transporter [Pontibacter sp. HSC-36F09]|uniref:MFS transporter n=1 Tax=Pontibacter sp. HSC-36F09 TaxID=2910966 RepID=UPI00209F494C|nr:MFS transporter [Pontibacter sp. HSC-36F09]MCP2045300.1 DHA2 family multidrug resistance protein-like MFS transporter [Pontibacter sp. HSC-36F09]